jgi:hypothetical protein
MMHTSFVLNAISCGGLIAVDCHGADIARPAMQSDPIPGIYRIHGLALQP